MTEKLVAHIKGIINSEDCNISVVLKDLTGDKWVLRQAERTQVPSASIIKILVMVEAFNQVIQGKLDLEQKIEISHKDKVKFSIITDLSSNIYTLRDIITLMIIVSDNTATNILIDLLGYQNINNMAERLDLVDTSLQRKMMDFEAIKLGKQNLTSALDMAILLNLIYANEILNSWACETIINILKMTHDKDMLGRYLDEDVIVAHKTGSLTNLNHDIGIFYLPNTTYLLGVFVTEAKTNGAAKDIIGKISRLVYDYYK